MLGLQVLVYTMMLRQVIKQSVLSYRRNKKKEKINEQTQSNTTNHTAGNTTACNTTDHNSGHDGDSHSAVLLLAQEVTQPLLFDPDQSCYLEMVLHYAFVVLFSLSCPAVPLLSLLRYHFILVHV